MTLLSIFLASAGSILGILLGVLAVDFVIPVLKGVSLHGIVVHFVSSKSK
jgi:hypothetical protein